MIVVSVRDYRWCVLVRDARGEWREPAWFKKAQHAKEHLRELESCLALRDGFVLRASYELDR